MPPLVHAVRHAQGYHNLTAANHTMHDPSITPLGEQQCHTFEQTFPLHQNVNLIVSSPLKRTLQTALLGFDKTLKARNLKILVLPELQETSDLPCDTGSTLQDLEKEFAGKPIDLSLLKPGWEAKQGRYSPAKKAIEARAKEARVWLRNRPEKEIVIVTHGGFLHYFTTDWSDVDAHSGTGWQNTEYRTYRFPEPENPEAPVEEIPASQQRRRSEMLKNKAMDEEEKMNLERTKGMSMDKQGEERAREVKVGKA